MHTLPPDVDVFVTQRYAYDELMNCLELLQQDGEWDNRASKIMFLEATRDYLEADAKIDNANELDLESRLGRRRCARANLLTILQLCAGRENVSTGILNRIIAHIGEFLRADPVIANG